VPGPAQKLLSAWRVTKALPTLPPTGLRGCATKSGPYAANLIRICVIHFGLCIVDLVATDSFRTRAVWEWSLAYGRGSQVTGGRMSLLNYYKGVSCEKVAPDDHNIGPTRAHAYSLTALTDPSKPGKRREPS